MRQDIMRYIEKDIDMLNYIRMRPHWYRKLSRDPETLGEFQIECKQFFRKTIPDRVGQIANSIQMAQIMMSLFSSKS